VRQETLHVDPAVKREPVAEFGVELLGRHRRSGRLNGIQHVDLKIVQQPLAVVVACVGQ
jgi:hypothetical protein